MFPRCEVSVVDKLRRRVLQFLGIGAVVAATSPVMAPAVQAQTFLNTPSTLEQLIGRGISDDTSRGMILAEYQKHRVANDIAAVNEQAQISNQPQIGEEVVRRKYLPDPIQPQSFPDSLDSLPDSLEGQRFLASLPSMGNLTTEARTAVRRFVMNPLFLQRFDVNGNGITYNKIYQQLVGRDNAKWGDWNYSATLDPNADLRNDPAIVSYIDRYLQDNFSSFSMDRPFTDYVKRPTIHSSLYTWYRANGPLPAAEMCRRAAPDVPTNNSSWGTAKSIPKNREMYDSRDENTRRDQMGEAHSAGIDVMAVSSFRKDEFKKGHAGLTSPADRAVAKYYWLYEHINGNSPKALPIDYEDGLPIHNFDDPNVRTKFIANMFELAEHFDDPNYHTITDPTTGLEMYPVWMWSSHIVRGAVNFARTVDYVRNEIRRTTGRELALIGGEQLQFPESVHPEENVETMERLRAFYAVTSYGLYSGFHIEGLSEPKDESTFNDLYIDATINNMKKWAEMTRGTQNTIYGTKANPNDLYGDRRNPDFWIPTEFGYHDNRGNPELRATNDQIDKFLNRVVKEVQIPFGITDIMHTSYNEHREATGLEPAQWRQQKIGFFDSCDFAYNDRTRDRRISYNSGYDYIRALLKKFGPSKSYKQNKAIVTNPADPTDPLNFELVSKAA